MSTIVDACLRGATVAADCPECKAEIEYGVPATFIGNLRVRCPSCRAMFAHPAPPPRNASSRPSASPHPGSSRSGGSTPRPGLGAGGGKRRGIGSDANPIDMAYYDVLGLQASCTTEEIKKAYRRLAIKLHPDKNRDDPDAEEKFKQIAVAYQILSDPETRKKYNEFGQKNGGGGAEEMVDPEEVFGKMFGGDAFSDLIGDISIGREMKDVFQQQAEDAPEDYMIGPKGQPVLTPEAQARRTAREKAANDAKAAERAKRVNKLAEHLMRKLSVFAEAAKSTDDPDVAPSFREICRLEAADLAHESYGVELLQAIGGVYKQRATQYTASAAFAPLGWFHGAKNTFATVSDTVSTLRSALELKSVFERLQAAEQAGMPPDELRKLEEQATEQGLRTLWKGAKLEVESVVREVCDRVLADPGASADKRQLRAAALGLMGDAFLSASKQEPAAADDFVRIETPQSKARDKEKTARPGVPPRPGAPPPPVPEKPAGYM